MYVVSLSFMRSKERINMVLNKFSHHVINIYNQFNHYEFGTFWILQIRRNRQFNSCIYIPPYKRKILGSYLCSRSCLSMFYFLYWTYGYKYISGPSSLIILVLIGLTRPSAFSYNLWVCFKNFVIFKRLLWAFWFSFSSSVHWTL